MRHISDAQLWQLAATVIPSSTTPASDCPGYWPPLAHHPRRWTGRHLFDPNTLTLGFARRFATYRDRTCCCTTRDGCCDC